MGFFSSRRAEPSPLSSSRSSISGSSSAALDEKSVKHLIRSRFYGKSKKSHNEGKPDLKSPYAPSVASIAETAPDVRSAESSKLTPFPRQSTSQAHLRRTSIDLTSMTLAQRLEELAVANGEGLLDDDEYRLLRQNLFERYSSLSALPAEAPIVPSVGPSTPSRRINTRPDPHARSASIRTQSSISSAVTSLVRKATKRSKRSSSNATTPDNESIRSLSSRASANPLGLLEPRQLGRQVSSVSLNTQSSRTIPHDVKSIVSVRSTRSTATQSDRNGSGARSIARSIRNGEPPPSSFSSRRLALWAQEDDRLRSATEIRSEIAETEAEAQRLLDAFNGLELSALTRHRNDHLSHSLSSGHSTETRDSAWTLIPDQASGFGPDVYSSRKISDRSRNILEGSSIRLHQLSKGKLAFPDAFPSDGVDHMNGLGVYGGSNSADYCSLVNATIQNEVEDIRRRKIDVTDRYQQRLDYLRARLKGAEIHERLIFK
ncbi:hypothetical protein SCHPADRAFT_910679 [Schizopora paradoxa]|uniref:Uncharacterized protein n=1 Tax=Schizopora paradoxa TaxID=27342 RepID=A0A0H2R2C8_9AGAM|nr:hypothetical protein SCHPADRAFT_910679 [Schizopora paradoxa]